MTNEELRKKRERLEIERNIQYLQNDLNYDNVDADMSLSIKDASDQELRKILRRLQMEAEAQRMAMDIKRRSVSEEERMYIDSKISTEEPINTLYHYGIQGMKWGVRKGRTGKIGAKSTLSRRDRKEQNFVDDPSKVYGKVYRKAAPQIRKGTRIINSKPEYKNKDFTKPSELRTKYYNEYSSMVSKSLNAAATSKAHPFTTKRVGMSPKKTLQMKFTFDVEKELRASYDIGKSDTKKTYKKEYSKSKSESSEGSLINVVKSKFKHSDTEPDDLFEVDLEVDLDDNGYVKEILEHTDFDSVDDFLMHYGIKGMRWGVRRGRNVSKKSSKKQSGDASDDHKTARSLKKKGTRSLSNSELKKVNERLQLERQFNALNPKQKSVGKRLASSLGKMTLNAVADTTKKQIGKQIDKRLGTKIEKGLDSVLDKKG